MFDRFEYTRVLNISRLWICQGSEYATGSKYARLLNILGLKNMPGLRRVLNVPEYT